jgi:hypothetical protein
MLAQTKHASMAAGFARQDIAFASFLGPEKSAILGLDNLGDAHTLKSFIGEYDLFGNPVFREGGLLAESVYRFKGQPAPAVISAEIDIERIDELVFRKLFAGMTRARLKLVSVLSGPPAALAESNLRRVFAIPGLMRALLLPASSVRGVTKHQASPLQLCYFSLLVKQLVKSLYLAA